MNIFSTLRPSEKVAATIAFAVFILSSFFVYFSTQKKFGVEVPDRGGQIIEGMVGNPRYINPILATSDVDKSLTNVIYSGLLKISANGQLVPDLAESWSISENGLIYTVHINPNAEFHDGTPLTTEDILFTIDMAKNPDVNSPIAANWSGVTVQKVDDRQITFTLKKAYAPFAENLTLGILPKHIWSTVPAQDFDLSAYYQIPIGSGAFKVKSIRQDKYGFIETYDLEAFKKYTLGRPYIDRLTIAFMKSEDEAKKTFEKKDIDTLSGIHSEVIKELVKHDSDTIIKTSTLPRIFALFFNQNTEPVFLHKEVRKALDVSVDKDQIIKEVLGGYGKAINSPIPITITDTALTGATTTESLTTEERIASARQVLEKAGWTLNASTSIYEKKTSEKTEKLAFTISTSNSTELIRTAELLKDQWTKIGADVKIETFESSDLTQKVIRPRKYGALLFGQIVGRDIDLYPFWHSTQRVDPGLNIASYTNTKANTALEIARSTSDQIKRVAARADFAKEVANDIPAVFLFSPEYIYAQNTQVFTDNMQFITEPSDRFININTWYTNTTYKWKLK